MRAKLGDFLEGACTQDEAGPKRLVDGRGASLPPHPGPSVCQESREFIKYRQRELSKNVPIKKQEYDFNTNNEGSTI